MSLIDGLRSIFFQFKQLFNWAAQMCKPIFCPRHFIGNTWSLFHHNGKHVNTHWCCFSSSSDSDCGSQLPCDQLVSPKALAACTRVDSCFAPWFVPSVGVSLQIAQLDLHLCHHLEQLGTGTGQLRSHGFHVLFRMDNHTLHCALPSPVPPRQLRPFLPDRKLPQDQEFMVISAHRPQVFLRQWSSGPQHSQDLSFSTQLECKLLEYRNLTHLQLVQPTFLQVASLLFGLSRSSVLARLQAS